MKINIGKGDWRYCPICGRSKGAFCFVKDEVYYDKQHTQKDPNGFIIACYRAKNAEKMATSGTSFVTLNEPGDGNLAISGVDGSQWAFIYEQKGEADSAGNVWCFFQDIASYERQQAWWAEKTKNKRNGNAEAKLFRRTFEPVMPVQREKIIKTAPTERLHEVYSAFLDLLVVEDWTKKMLTEKDGWDEEMYNYLVDTYNIKTLPPSDKDRFGEKKEFYSFLYKKSLSRKAIMEKLIEKVGEPDGVPGFQFYETENGKKWTVSSQEGYLIPVYDPKGYIVRLRIRLSEETLLENGREAYENKIETYFEQTKAGYIKYQELMVIKYEGDIDSVISELAFGPGFEQVTVDESDELAVARYKDKIKSAEKRLELMEKQWNDFIDFYQEHDDEIAYKKAKAKFLAMNFDGNEEKALKHYKSKGGKYKWLSSSEKYGGTASETLLGFYGLEWLDSYKSGETRVIVTEGEKKGMVAAYYLGYIVITLPGVAQFSLLDKQKIPSVANKTCFEWLKSIGVTTIAVANDADMLTNANVYKATEGLCKLVIEKGFNCEIAQWSETGGKGIDDACIASEEIDFLQLY